MPYGPRRDSVWTAFEVKKEPHIGEKTGLDYGYDEKSYKEESDPND